jgi:hypothetical protein
LDELKNKSRHLEAEVEKLQHDSRQESIWRIFISAEKLFGQIFIPNLRTKTS